MKHHKNCSYCRYRHRLDLEYLVKFGYVDGCCRCAEYYSEDIVLFCIKKLRIKQIIDAIFKFVAFIIYRKRKFNE